MRILDIRFKNLNSLVGEWEIDLSNPAFSADGIFAIVGPTGAGKTTILDAICLALYGRTPRINKVTKNSNEIMSRQTAECFAEVTFATQAGRFRCHWSQHRARKKPNGELQAPKHEIANADTGHIFEAKLRGVAEQIEIATGMDFERFTRSMLLAQGGFAAFLQAAPNDRAPILEQITGTEIYSHISIGVHERRTEERNKLDTLHAELAGMPLLTEEERLKWQSRLQENVLQETNLSKDIAQKNAAISWLEGISLLEKSIQKLAERKQVLDIRQNEFKPKLEKLARANRALELSGKYAEISSLRLAQKNDMQSFDEYRKKIPEQTLAVEQAQKTLKFASEQLATKKNELVEILPSIRKTREIDLKLIAKAEPIKTIDNLIAEIQKTLVTTENKITTDIDRLAAFRTNITQVQNILKDHHSDKNLIEEFSGLNARFSTLRELNEKKKLTIKETLNAEKNSVKAEQLWLANTYQLADAYKIQNAAQSDFTQQLLTLQRLLANKEASDWRELLIQLKEKQVILENLHKNIKTLTQSQHLLSTLNMQQKQLNAEESMLAKKISEHIEKQEGLEREAQLLEIQISLVNKILSFENARKQLQDNQQCPLCGALDHPFAKGNIPAINETQNAIKRAKSQLNKVSSSLVKLKIKQAETQKDLAQINTQKQVTTEHITVTRNAIQSGLSGFSIQKMHENIEDNISQLISELIQQNNEALENTSKVLFDIEQHEKKLHAVRSRLEARKESTSKAERNIQDSLHQKETAKHIINQLNEQRDSINMQLENIHQDTLHLLQPYGINHLSIDDIEKIKHELISRREQWLNSQSQYHQLEKEIASLALEIKHQKEIIGQAEKERIKQQNSLHDLLLDCKQLRCERLALFGDKNTDHEESKLTTEIANIETQAEQFRAILSSKSQYLADLTSKMAALEKAIKLRETQLSLLEKAFLLQLKKANFSDEKDYLSACFPEKIRNELLHEAQSLETENISLLAMQKDKMTTLEIELQKKITDQKFEPLAQALDQALTIRSKLHQTIGGIRQKLDDDKKLQKQQQVRLAAIDAQKRECSRWDILHDLIGSADGRKYRNFAQGLTFEMMVGHANQQLQKMTDRYLLIRDKAQPLELNVVDNYQAGEIRSTKNLSGGESFIVSLSLALGLSQMASKNVRVDSLFLDEGFGTLDEDALDIALETLVGLQQDGKLIGVISHVPTLKERISTQIQVSPQSGGISTISGPGCRQLIERKLRKPVVQEKTETPSSSINKATELVMN